MLISDGLRPFFMTKMLYLLVNKSTKSLWAYKKYMKA